jgi:hypothetical protein
MENQTPQTNENLPALKVIIESIKPKFEELEDSRFKEFHNGVEFTTIARGAGFEISAKGQLIAPRATKRKECEVMVDVVYYVEVSDRRIIVRENKQVAIQLMAELASQTICYAVMYMQTELKRRFKPLPQFPYFAFSQFYPQAERFLKSSPLVQ